ncbi:hypothetical protein GVAV_001552 [Gurleya vavrai]
MKREKTLYFIKRLSNETEDPKDNSILDYMDRLHVLAIQGEIPADVLCTLMLKGLSDDWEGRIQAARRPEADLD